MKIRQAMFLISVAAFLATLPVQVRSQMPSFLGDSSGTVVSATSMRPNLTYVRPTRRTEVNNYLFDTFGPYPTVMSAFGAGINQAYNTPPEWHQGTEAYGKRFGSDFGIAAVSTTTRYGLSAAFKEDARRPSCLLCSSACGSLCRFDDRHLWLVPQPLWRQGRIPDGQLQPASLCGRKRRPGILL